MTEPVADQGRSLEKAVELNARVEDVWRALTDGEELSRWFPPVARVEPGQGGTVFISWGPGMEGTSRIEVWEPNRALRIADAYGAIDYFIEARGEACVLRLVHSGFSADASFDDQFEGVNNGWAYFLYNLKHYLERHAGQPRHMISLRKPPGKSREEAWPGIVRALRLTPPSAQASEAHTLQLGGDSYSGTVVLNVPARAFAGTVRELNDGLLFVELEGGGENWQCGLWLSVYGAEPDRARLQAALAGVLE